MLSPKDQRMLKASCFGDGSTGKNNPVLNQTIKEIMEKSPWLFHTDVSLDTRRFYHKPFNIPFASAVK